MSGITDEDLHKASNVFNRFGASDLKSKIIINLSNILEMCCRFSRAHLRNVRFVTWDLVLLKMCQTGNYFVTASWITPYAGKGLEIARADAVWKMVQRPEDMCMTDVHLIFFGIVPNSRKVVDPEDVVQVVQSWAQEGHHIVLAAQTASRTDVFEANADFVPICENALE